MTVIPMLKNALVRVLRILSGVPIVSLLMGGLLFLVFSTTLSGRCIGLGAVLLGGILFGSVGYWNREWFRTVRVRLLGGLLPLALLLFTVPALMAPRGTGADDGHVQSCFLHDKGTFPAFSPWNIIPEMDQIKVGTSIIPLGDPHVDFAKTKRVRSLVLPVYEEMEKDADFLELGSVLGMGYRELFRLEFRTGHYYVSLPKEPVTGRLPCIVFLHGMGGNWKSYLWVLSKISTRHKCAIIAPTFGLGNWDKPGSDDFVVSVAKEALATLPLDPENLYLTGYSNGAMGVTRAAIKGEGLFKGLVYLSPVTEDELFSSPGFLEHYRGRNVLFLHGGRDRRIPRDFVEGTAAILRRHGVNVRLKIYDQEDHFLLFSQQEAVIADLVGFLFSRRRVELKSDDA